MSITRAQRCREAAACLHRAAGLLRDLDPPPDLLGPEVVSLIVSLAEWAEAEAEPEADE